MLAVEHNIELNLSALEVLLAAMGLIASGAWASWLLLVRREVEPSTELSIEVSFAGIQDHQWLIEVAAILSNRGLVRQFYRDFQLSVRYLLPADEIHDSDVERLKHQIHFPHSIDTRIGTKRLYPNAVYINPKLTFRHSYITSVPQEATFVWVSCKFMFRTREHWFSLRTTEHLKNAQRLFRVPRQNSCQVNGLSTPESPN